MDAHGFLADLEAKPQSLRALAEAVDGGLLARPGRSWIAEVLHALDRLDGHVPVLALTNQAASPLTGRVADACERLAGAPLQSSGGAV